MKASLVALVALSALSLTAIADARSQVTIRGELPFDERALGDAVELRLGEARLADVAVVVGRDDQGQLVVEVGGRTQTVVLMTSDPLSAARIVAMVVVELAAEPPAGTPVAVAPPPGAVVVTTAAPAPRGPSRLSVRLVPQLLRDDNGATTKQLAGSLAYRLSPVLRLVGTVGIGVAEREGSRETVLPLRAGIEGTSGVLGLELGVTTLPYSSTCSAGKQSSGVHGAVRLYLPVGERARAMIEGGGDFMVTGYSETCIHSYAYREYGGWVGAGVEWPL